jgi:hypothetical protein
LKINGTHKHGGFLFLCSFSSPICSLHEGDKLDQREGEGEGEADREAWRERQRQRECARVRAAFGALGICARRNTVRAKGGGDEREFIGPLLSADGCARARTHTLCIHAQMTSAAAAAAMHKDTGLAHRLTDVPLALHARG